MLKVVLPFGTVIGEGTGAVTVRVPTNRDGSESVQLTIDRALLAFVEFGEKAGDDGAEIDHTLPGGADGEGSPEHPIALPPGGARPSHPIALPPVAGRPPTKPVKPAEPKS